MPKSLPALVKAIRIQDKVKGVGFDWDNKEQVWAKFQEEIKEFQVEEQKQDQEKMEQEFGDILFSFVNYARFVGINPEDALEKTNKKFLKRFTEMELDIKAEGKDMKNMSLVEMDEFWEVAKRKQSKAGLEES